LDAGAAALSLAAPRGALTKAATLVSGRLYGPSLFPQALETVANAAKLGLAVIGSGGVYNNENASAMLAAGAQAVQIDSALWKGFNAGQ
jgi:dihydroorotate dehydrogenase (NAD+) catalytic subunit